jgi:hypothetical protein
VGDHPVRRLQRHADQLSFSDVAELIEEIDEDGLHIKAYFDQNLPDNQAFELGHHGEGVIYHFPIQQYQRYVACLGCKRLSKAMLFLEQGVFD